jgi:CheY-like chemotaxis protein
MPHVLVVEDDRASADSLAELMGTLGFEVRVASNGEEALNKAYEFLPDVILLDIGLPVRDGYQVACALREVPDSSTSFIVAVTGREGPDEEARSQQAGIDLFLTKPIDVAYLKAILTEYRRELES